MKPITESTIARWRDRLCGCTESQWGQEPSHLGYGAATALRGVLDEFSKTGDVNRAFRKCVAIVVRVDRSRAAADDLIDELVGEASGGGSAAFLSSDWDDPSVVSEATGHAEDAMSALKQAIRVMQKATKESERRIRQHNRRIVKLLRGSRGGWEPRIPSDIET